MSRYPQPKTVEDAIRQYQSIKHIQINGRFFESILPDGWSQAIQQFSHKSDVGRGLTPKQANFALVILRRFKSLVKTAGLNHDALLANSNQAILDNPDFFSYPFDTLVIEKNQMWVDTDDKGVIMVHYQTVFNKKMKEDLDRIRDRNFPWKWDPTVKTATLVLTPHRAFNLQLLADKYDFDVDEDLQVLFARCREIRAMQIIVPEAKI